MFELYGPRSRGLLSPTNFCLSSLVVGLKYPNISHIKMQLSCQFKLDLVYDKTPLVLVCDRVHLFRYAAILFKKQRYVSGQHKVNLKIICKENYKYEVQEKSPANQAVTVQQLAEEYWR